MQDAPRRCPVSDFDHHSDAHGDDPVAAYHRQREQAPIAWTEAHGGFWIVSDWDGVAAVSGDDDTYSSARTPHGGDGLAIVIPKAPTALHIPIELDPPAFQRYRRLLMDVAKASEIERLQPVIGRHPNDL